MGCQEGLRGDYLGSLGLGWVDGLAGKLGGICGCHCGRIWARRIGKGESVCTRKDVEEGNAILIPCSPCPGTLTVAVRRHMLAMSEPHLITQGFIAGISFRQKNGGLSCIGTEFEDSLLVIL